MTTRRASRLMYPFDWIVIGYCLIVIVFVLLFGRPFNEYLDELVAYGSMMGFAALIVRYVDEDRNAGLKILRYLYPLLLIMPMYRLTGGTMFLIFDRFFDAQLVHVEELIFGIEPTLFIDQHLLQPLVNEVFSFCYFSYYAMIPLLVFPLLIAREYRLFGRAVSALMLTFAISFLLFVLYPVEGPRWVFATQYQHTVDGYFFRHAVQWVIANGAVHGGAMPSSHTAVALIATIYVVKRFRILGWIMGVVTFGLAIGTFWGRYHYVSDVVVGIAIALFAHWLIEKYYDRWSRREAVAVAGARVLDHVS